MCIKCLVHIFSGSLGSAVDKRTRNNCMRIKCLVHIFSGSFGSAVDKRTRNNCMRVKCKIRIFSSSLHIAGTEKCSKTYNADCGLSVY